MLDMPMRLVIAYGLLVLMVLAGAAFVWWRSRNTHRRRDERRRGRLAELYRKRDEAAAGEP